MRSVANANIIYANANAVNANSNSIDNEAITSSAMNDINLTPDLRDGENTTYSSGWTPGSYSNLVTSLTNAGYTYRS